MLLSLQPLHPVKVQRLADELGFDETWLQKPVKGKAKPKQLSQRALIDGPTPPAMPPRALTDDHDEPQEAPSKAPPAMPNPAQPNLSLDESPAAISAIAGTLGSEIELREATPAQSKPAGATPATPAQSKHAGATPALPSIRNVSQQLAAAPSSDEARDRIAANREAALARRRMRQAQDTIDLVLVWNSLYIYIYISVVLGTGHHQLQCILFVYIYIYTWWWCLELAIIIFKILYIYMYILRWGYLAISYLIIPYHMIPPQLRNQLQRRYLRRRPLQSRKQIQQMHQWLFQQITRPLNVSSAKILS